MEIREIVCEKKRFLSLLLLGDEQESMIDRYLERGTLYVLEDNGVKGVCVVTDEGDGVLEIKNLAIAPGCQRQGYGRTMLDWIAARYREAFRVLQLGTGDSPAALPFYEHCGFVRSHVIPGFFTEYYDHPIYEDGVLLKDMVYLQKPLA